MRLLLLPALVILIAAPASGETEQARLAREHAAIMAKIGELRDNDKLTKEDLQVQIAEILATVEDKRLRDSIDESIKLLEEASQEQKKEKTKTEGKDEKKSLPTDPTTMPGYKPKLSDLKRGSLNEHKNRKPGDPETWRNSGNQYFDERDYGNTVRDLDRAIRLGLVDPQVLTTYGNAAFQLGDYDLAEKAGARALGMDPSDRNADALYKLAKGRVSKVTLPSALRDTGLGAQPPPAGFQEAQPGSSLAASPPAGEGWGAAGTQSAAEMAAAGARAAAESQAVAADAKVRQSAAFAKQAASALALKDWLAARTIASQAIDIYEGNAQAWNYRAIANNRLGRYNDAVYDASFALGLVPGNAPALQTRSWAFNKQRKFREALADANYTLEREPDSGFAYQNRAYALAGMGDRDAALESLRRSAEIDPRFKPIYERAMQAPSNSDLLFLFDEEPVDRATAGGRAPSERPKRFARLIFLSLSGGLLVALGILHIVSASWRERVNTTIRRVLSGAASPGRGAPSAGVVSGGFWTQYELVRELGAGGMGLVYEAQDKSLERRVAVKKMRDEIRAEPSERARFVSEAKMVAALHHPNIVDIYSIVEDDQDVYLVFEYVPGRTLADLLREKGPMTYEEAKEVLRGACEAVQYAHAHKIIHRDLKPSNIMMTEDGRAKVMDFGVARQAKDAMTKMSMTNTIVGTPPYMAPEQEQGGVRKESDIFALGVCFYEMLSGSLPFSGQGAGMLLNKINGRHLPLTAQVKEGLPPGVDQVIAKALAPDPEKRYRSSTEFFSAVEALASPKG